MMVESVFDKTQVQPSKSISHVQILSESPNFAYEIFLIDKSKLKNVWQDLNMKKWFARLNLSLIKNGFRLYSEERKKSISEFKFLPACGIWVLEFIWKCLFFQKNIFVRDGKTSSKMDKSENFLNLGNPCVLERPRIR